MHSLPLKSPTLFHVHSIYVLLLTYWLSLLDYTNHPSMVFTFLCRFTVQYLSCLQPTFYQLDLICSYSNYETSLTMFLLPSCSYSLDAIRIVKTSQIQDERLHVNKSGCECYTYSTLKVSKQSGTSK